MEAFSDDADRDENMGEIVLETVLSANIDSVTDLNLGSNMSWFKHPTTGEERSGNVDLLAELISKQDALQQIDLSANYFSSSATQTILTRIADHPSTHNKLQSLNLCYSANFEADETVSKLADIL